jgi:hypothetical protein
MSRNIVSARFTRPSDTTAYASGDLVANSTTAGSVVPMSFPAWSTSQAASYLGSVDVTVDKAFTDGAAGLATVEINCGGPNLYGLLEARGAYTPTSAGVFNVTLEIAD